MPDKRLRAGIASLAMAAALAPGTIAPAQVVAPWVTTDRPSLNLYGVTGLIDMPSAESQPDGQVSASYAMFGNTTRRNFTFQLLPRLSATLRYATIRDWGRENDPDYNLFDRSLDLQFQILKERGAWQPSLALGFRDFLGTGVYSAEYLVATKTVQDFKFSAGMGWGRLAGIGAMSNPFCDISEGMCQRDEDFGEGGNVAWGRFFSGEDVGLFGGVEWTTPVDGLTLKAEYSSDTYDREQLYSDFERKSPWNFGAEYRLRKGVTLGGYFMYGDAVGFNVVFSGNPSEPLVPQNLDPAPVPVNPRPPGPHSTSWVNDATARETLITAVSGALSDEGVTLQEVKFAPTQVDVRIYNRRINQAPKAIGRTARILAAAMPYSVETFTITPIEDGVPTTTVTISRTALERDADRPQAALATWERASFSGAWPMLSGSNVWRRDVYPFVDWAILPVPSIQFFGGNEGFHPQLSAEFRGSVRFSEGLSVTGRVRQPILGEFADPGPDENDEDTGLPPVRRQSGRYYAEWDPKLMRLTGDYLFKLNQDTYGRVSAGYLERSFAGVSAEVLWKPVDQNWGLGLELNQVWQRNYAGLGFGYYDYDVTMGHASVYWDTGWYGLEAQVDAGRYLAGDWGATLTLTREFANGWRLGAYFTKTDVPASDFGEGSFDKGLLLTIPLRWSTPFETRQEINGDLRSLSSDGGAQLNIANRLYPTVRDLDKRRLGRSWGEFWQ
jgi:hypothetical protein